MKKVLSLVLLSLVLLFPRQASAQDAEQILQYDTDISIQTDGTIRVIEHIQYFFDSPRHGILRNIPVVKTNADGKQYKITLKEIAVADESGNSYPFVQSQEGSDVVVKIGDPDRTILGLHQYVISYQAEGALTYFPGHDELYWNWVGTKWQVPILASTGSVTLPKILSQTEFPVTCYIGAEKETGSECKVTYGTNSVMIATTRVLSPNEGATFVIGFPKGIVGVLEPVEVVPFFTTPLGKIVLIFLGIGALLWYIITPLLVIRKWWRVGRDPKPSVGETSAWYSPPKTRSLRELTPAETGSLVDETVDPRDIYASIVDLARRGYLRIIERKEKVFLQSGVEVFDFEKMKDWNNDTHIQAFERELLDGIFVKKDLVNLKELDLSETFETVKKQIYDSLVSEGYFPANPQKTRILYYVLAGFAFVTGNFILFPVALIFGKHMPRKTQFGAEAAAMGRSLRNFLGSQKKQLAFQAKNQMMFEKLLPYAIVFGVEQLWAKRFASVNLKQPNWYKSSTGGTFNSILFAQSIGKAASVSFTSSITSKSSSGFSSGFSGGSSGGGGGGGGGGSW